MSKTKPTSDGHGIPVPDADSTDSLKGTDRHVARAIVAKHHGAFEDSTLSIKRVKRYGPLLDITFRAEGDVVSSSRTEAVLNDYPYEFGSMVSYSSGRVRVELVDT